MHPLRSPCLTPTLPEKTGCRRRCKPPMSHLQHAGHGAPGRRAVVGRARRQKGPCWAARLRQSPRHKIERRLGALPRLVDRLRWNIFDRRRQCLGSVTWFRGPRHSIFVAESARRDCISYNGGSKAPEQFFQLILRNTDRRYL